MSYSHSVEHTAAVVAALAELGVRPGERVLIMLPDGPGFAEVFAGTIQHQAVPLPVNPGLPAHDIAATAAKAGARLLLASADQIRTLTDLDTEPPILIDGLHRACVAALRLCSSGGTPSRKQVVLLPHSPITSTDTHSTTTARPKVHRHEPTVSHGSLQPARKGAAHRRHGTMIDVSRCAHCSAAPRRAPLVGFSPSAAGRDSSSSRHRNPFILLHSATRGPTSATRKSNFRLRLRFRLHGRCGFLAWLVTNWPRRSKFWPAAGWGSGQ
jgi:hypothetical protein